MICLQRVSTNCKQIFDAFRDTFARKALGGGGGGGGKSLFVHFRSYSRASPFNIMCNFVADAMGNFTF